MVKNNNEVALTLALTVSPATIIVNGGPMQFYTGGVFDDPVCGHEMTHAILAVGYGTDGGKDFYKAKNSWSEHWGENGYIRLKRGNATNAPGQCGVAQRAVVVKGKKK